MSDVAKIVNELKDNNQDFEFYPTTDEIIDLIKQDMYTSFTNTTKPKFRSTDFETGLFVTENKISILDIGAGNGQTLNKLATFLNGHKFNDVYVYDNKLEYDDPISRELRVYKYAIEKSSILTHNYKNTYINFLGSDFFETTFSMNFNVVFCNPPYSNYKLWINNIFNTIIGNPLIYLVIPSSWKDDKNLKDFLDKQNIELTVLGTFDFLDGDRKARVDVDVIRIKLLETNNPINDSIKKLFTDNCEFKIEDKPEPDFKPKNQNELTDLNGNDYAHFICDEYNKEIDNLNASLTEISKVSLSSLHSIFGLDLSGIIDKFTTHKKEICSKYWNAILNKVCTIEKRLIDKHRRNLLSNIIDKSLDFNLSNIYYIIEQIINITGEKLNEQVLDIYNDLLKNSPVEKYKSNERMFKDNNTELKDPRVKLTPRIVLELGKYHGGFEMNWQDRATDKLTSYTKTKIQDIIIVIKSIGIDTDFDINNSNFKAGKTTVITGTFNKKEITVMELKVFINGNIHIKLNKDVLIKFNIIKGILEGWVNSANDIMEEFDVSEDDAVSALQFKEIKFNLLN